MDDVLGGTDGIVGYQVESDCDNDYHTEKSDSDAVQPGSIEFAPDNVDVSESDMIQLSWVGFKPWLLKNSMRC